MKISKKRLHNLIEQILKEEDFSILSLADEIRHFTEEINSAAQKNDLPTLLKMYKGLGGVVQKASKTMKVA